MKKMTMKNFNKFFPYNVLATYSDKEVDFTPKLDFFDLINYQRRHLEQNLGRNIKMIYAPKQVHGDTVFAIDQAYVDNPFEVEADAIVTDIVNVPIAVRTADCLPIFIYDPMHKVIAVVHAGWKGTLARIVEGALMLMMSQWETDTESVKVAFGPSIRSCCYAVGEEFKEHFPDDIIEKDGKLFIDLAQINKEQLTAFGVLEQNIFDQSECTCCSGKYHSYRKDGKNAGRMISLMMLLND